LLRAHRDKAAARKFFEQAIDRNGAPEKVTIDKSGSNIAALEAMNTGREKPIIVRQERSIQCACLTMLVYADHLRGSREQEIGLSKFSKAWLDLRGTVRTFTNAQNS
jgi:hypothetical protein